MELETNCLKVGDVLRIRRGTFNGLLGIIIGFEYEPPQSRYVDEQHRRQLYQIRIPLGRRRLTLLVEPAQLESTDFSCKRPPVG